MSDPGLLVLSRADIIRLMAYDDYVAAVEAAFVAAAKGDAVAPPAAALHVPGGSFHAKGAALLGKGAVTAIKINGNFPGNPAANGLPTVQGVIYLADAVNGRPLAVMDSIEVTINRTAAATTLAARHLARPDSRIAMVCGAGAGTGNPGAPVWKVVTIRSVKSPARSGVHAKSYVSPTPIVRSAGPARASDCGRSAPSFATERHVTGWSPARSRIRFWSSGLICMKRSR